MRLGDLISREALKEVIKANHYLLSAKHNSTDYGMFTTGIIEAIDNAPTVCGNNPKWCENCVSKGKCASTRPHGEWEIVDAEGVKIWKCVCTECGHDPQECIAGTEDWWLRKYNLPNYCPNCGAKMDGGEE